MSYFELYEKRKQLKPGSVWTHWRYPHTTTVKIILIFNRICFGENKTYIEYTLDDGFCSHYHELYSVLPQMKKIRD